MFHKIDLNTWKRAQTYYYFSQIAPTAYSITVEVDVTAFVNAIKEKGVKFFPAYLWLVTKNLNKQQEFKCALKDGILGYYDELVPLYATWHQNDETFSLMWTEYNDDFNVFYTSYLENKKKYGNQHGFLSQPLTPPPENAYTVSEIPWLNFNHFAVHNFDNKKYFFPSVEAGKYIKKENKIYMPLSLTVHHATTDGYHVSKFIDDLQNDMNNF